MDLTIIQKICIWALPLIFAITLHEVAHGYMAYWLGDYTAKLSGRLTLNPVKHADLVGTILIPLMTMIFGGFIFGWAKPVPVDARNFKSPRRDMALVAVSGVIANFIMAILWAAIAKLGMYLHDNGNIWLGLPLVYMGGAGIILNLVLGVLNLIPIPPLDGGRLLQALLPPRAAYQLGKLEPFGFFILLLLLLLGIISLAIEPIIIFLREGIDYLFGFM